MNTFVCKLYDSDTFYKEGADVVNINNNQQYNYTLWKKSQRLYRIPKEFTREALDLFYLSLMVFYADRIVLRSEQPDGWTRHITIYMPVWNESKWNECSSIVKRMLDFLTGDDWTLFFRQRTCVTDDEAKYKKGKFRLRHTTKHIDVDTFCMLSGGLDSFIGAIDILSKKEKTIFVGNYNGGKGVSVYQNKVIDSLSNHFKVPRNNFYQFYAAPKRGRENTTRSRSLLFFSHAILLASGMNKPIKLCIPENGVISLNIPLTEHRLGSLSTRTTHPYFIGLLQELLKSMNIQISLYNPYQFSTKGEMMANCMDFNCLKMSYQDTMSCSHPDLGRWRKESSSSHCGVCLPCTIRRAAIMKAGLNDSSIYRDKDYMKGEAIVNLKSYKLGLKRNKEPLLAIQESGPITFRKQDFADLYSRGLQELKDFVDSL